MVKQIFSKLRTPEAVYTATLNNYLIGFNLLSIRLSKYAI
jgi:hypothetical protein